jgi:hypothetical protein
LAHDAAAHASMSAGSKTGDASYPMKPTAPPVKRGSPGTNGDWNSAIRRRSAGMNGSQLSVVTPDRSMIVRPAR